MGIGTLAGALASAMGKIGTVAQTGRNAHDRYTYASDADLKAAIQPVLSECGLAIVPIAFEHSWDTVDSAKGRPQTRCRLVVTYRIAHASGEFIDAQAVGEGIDRGDKAAYKAQTGALKYLLRTVFAVPTSDDAEQHSPTRRPARPRDSRPFAVRLADIVAPDVTPEDVDRWHRAQFGRPVPTDEQDREDLLAHLSAGGLSEVTAWINAQTCEEDA